MTKRLWYWFNRVIRGRPVAHVWHYCEVDDTVHCYWCTAIYKED